jgi:hypothetical protein
VTVNSSSGYFLLNGSWLERCDGDVREGAFSFLRPFTLEMIIRGSDALFRR